MLQQNNSGCKSSPVKSCSAHSGGAAVHTTLCIIPPLVTILFCLYFILFYKIANMTKPQTKLMVHGYYRLPNFVFLLVAPPSLGPDIGICKCTLSVHTVWNNPAPRCAIRATPAMFFSFWYKVIRLVMHRCLSSMLTRHSKILVNQIVLRSWS